ncbi:MAG: c-type cytochrome [Candidatus Neomarinimicrobiota bacterium]|nr:c-type cytochrome [Candidatus Neomarinimicrobiota bacterium]
MRLNKLFGISSIFFLALLIWTFADDYDRTWKDYQREFRRIDSELTAQLRTEEQIRIEESADYQTASEELTKATAVLESQAEDLKVLEEQQKRIDSEYYKVQQELAFSKSLYDVAKYEYEAAISHYGGHAEEQKRKMDQLGADVHQKTLAVQEAEAQLAEKKKEIGAMTSALDVAEKTVSSLERQVEVYSRKLTTIDPGSMTIGNRVATAVRDLPVIDFMNPYLKINQIIIPDITDDMNFVQMPKVDRCTTCHLGIDKPGFEDAPQPYTTHPDLDLFLTSSSAHPMEEYGCTSCHAGRGRGTDFVTASHSPSSHEQEEEWVEKYNWNEMHHWETPMYPSQYTEAGCLKCHSSQPYISGAGDLNVGLALFEKLSCNGCHLVERYEGKLAQRVGPNLSHLASKTTREWAYRWIEAPRKFRENTWMPHFFNVADWDDEEDRARANQEIHSIVDYLFDKSAPFDLAAMPRLGNVERGEYLFNNLGCKGCHKLEPEPEQAASYTLASLRQEHGPNLTGLGSKTSQEWLFSWLKDPKKYHPGTPMPNLRLSDVEAADLSNYLHGFSNDPFMASPISPVNEEIQSDIAFQLLTKMNSDRVARETLASMDLAEMLDYNGEKLLQYYGCAGCHLIPGFEDAKRIGVALDGEGSKPLTKLDFGYTSIPHTKIDWFTQKVKNPRSFDLNKVAGPYDGLKMPDFGLTDEEVEKIVTVILALNTNDNREKPVSAARSFVEEGQWIIKKNNCMGCHLIEERGGDILVNYIAPEYAPPNLNTEGQKIQPRWLLNFFEKPMSVRPNLLVRMPSFHLGEEKWNNLIKYFQYYDGQTTPYEGDYSQRENSVAFRAGAKLHEMGACNNCHYYGTIQPLQDPQTWAPNLALTKERLRPDWVDAWMRDPQSIMPGTKMPKPYIPSEEELSIADASEIYGTDLMRLAGDEETMVRGLTDYIYAIPGKTDISAEIKAFFNENGYGFLEGEEETDDWDEEWEEEEWQD